LSCDYLDYQKLTHSAVVMSRSIVRRSS